MVQRLHKTALVALMLLATGAACKSKPASQSKPVPSSTATPTTTGATAANLTDLSISLDAVRAAFNAHKQEARFLTLLAPT